MNYLFYLLVALAATMLGALTGMGGGVILKPALDLLGDYDAATINILSSITVFVMAVVSVAKQTRHKTGVAFKVSSALAIGSLMGGSIGQHILTALLQTVPPNRAVAIQNIGLIIIILCVLVYMRRSDRPTLNLLGALPGFPTGILLGLISSFLGIGGGPFNVALIIFVFNCSVKTAACYSIITIMFAQASKLGVLLMSGTIQTYNLSMLPLLITGAIVGSWVGSTLGRRLTDKSVQKAFTGVQILVLFICILNIYRS